MSTFTPIQHVRVLHDHISPDTAYPVDDYPSGGLRCKIRYWMETATKGRYKGQTRFVYQTTNPKKLGHPWNKPKADTYAHLVVMYLNADDHVKFFAVSYDFDISPVTDAKLRLMGIYDELTTAQRAEYDLKLTQSQANVENWTRFEDTITDLANHIREHGHPPTITDNVWEGPRGRRVFHYSTDTYLTLAHQRANTRA